jgi:hypothetical protein
MPADFLSRSFTEINTISALDIDWVHEQEKDNLSTLVKESLNNEWTYKFPMPEWYRKAENIAKMAIIRNNVNWIKKDGKRMIYVPYAMRNSLLFSVQGDLQQGTTAFRNAKKDCSSAIFWLNMDEDILAHTKECLKC